MRWDRPRELARTMPDRDERIQCALRHCEEYNVRAPSDKMRYSECAHVWNVYGTELREEIEWNQMNSDSDADDVMQQ